MLDPRSALQQRPSIEQIIAQYGQMQERLRDLLDHLVGPLRWAVSTPETRVDCTEFAGSDAESRVLESWRAAEPIADHDWPSAVSIVRSITAEYGFGEPEIIVNRTGDHEITGNDSYGAVYTFGTAKATILTLTTGCHLPSALKS
ncbi:LppA family lipoprotein [Saccharopolyspora sp. TS4A08]|uniref:LppA family lipoprotein n=1 Tax=Saccharopolyspora ipomoeae TaxID=3042027 RepID=A0ABT6PX25_9PSEU|nr:LppA family lipoprotein [Saccharopolyspora sp. TS4A08]MDI2032547.1 LppA family lipoprotein [Saccharopolyspora sp. TS4A08]